MSQDGDDNDKVIDITDYVTKAKSEEELELENFTNHFVSILNENLAEKRKKIAKDRYIHFMINFILLTQVCIVFVICFIIAKLYS